jgi:hypothetical protein
MKNPHAVALGRLGGRKGGAAGGRVRAEALSAGRRVEIARGAALSLPDHLDLVMLHVLTRGGEEDRRWLVRRFGDKGIRRWILERHGRGLTVRQMSPWVSERTARRWQDDDPYALIWENR